MEKDKLLKSAGQLVALSDSALKEFDLHMDQVLVTMNEKMLERDDVLALLGGEINLSMMKDNHENHLRFIRSILESPDPETLVDTVLWVFRAYMSRGFHTNYWSAQLNTWVHVMEAVFTEATMAEVVHIYNWMIINIPNFTIASDEKLEKSMHKVE